ncbi:hypothetical protein BDW02DRAFT_608286 [Decorospora gaudefroyi]|uniref:Uncharacterized protein n=1 Tax=Decorospora gaudefroyi TaxID=184978 RepID=A0A6A5K7T6_9PLEO|nr:hypothetical protein BDW02DRAFT_608286 [Decorospora gaudefroyi]
MAIATAAPGLDVTIEVDGTPLPEYEHGPVDDHELPTSTMDIVLDDNYIQAPFVEWGGKEECEGYICSRSTSSISGHHFTQGFRFSELIDALKSIGVIARTPSPSPPPEPEVAERDLDNMTEEEVREELRRIRDDTIQIKREREEERKHNESSFVGDDEVEWICSQPAERCVKRVRRGPRIGDDVVDLD